MNAQQPIGSIQFFFAERRTALGMSVALFILVIVAATSYVVMQGLRSRSSWNVASEEALQEIYLIKTGLLQTESETRAYAITRSPEYLHNTASTHDTILASLGRVHLLLASDSAQVARIARLRQLIDRRYDSFNRTVAGVTEGGSEEAIRVVRGQEGFLITPSILAALDQVDSTEHASLNRRRVESNALITTALVTLLGGSITALAVFFGLFLLLNRQVKRRIDAERLTKENEQRFLGFLELVPAGIFILTSQGRPYFANLAAQRLLGGSSDAILSPGELAEAFQAYVAGSRIPYPNERNPLIAALRGERSTVVDLEVERNGMRIPLIVTGAPLVGATGSVEYALAAFVDATDLQYARQRLEESESRFRQIIESASDIIYRTDQNGYFTFVNPIGLRIFGYNEDAVKKVRFTELVRPDVAERVRRFYLRQALTRTSSSYLEFPAVTTSGRQIILGQNVTLLREGDAIQGFQAVARDVTEERRAQEALARREQQLDTVISTVDEGITFSDEHGYFEIFNRKMEKLTGYSKEEANASDDFSQLISVSPGEHQSGLDRLKEVLVSGRISDVETTIRTKTHEIRTLLVSTTLVTQGHRRMFLSVYRDITEERKHMAQLKEATRTAETAARAKADFLATMSHEIRTPMNGVIGMTHLLLDTPLSDEQRDLAKNVSLSAELLLTIINDILDFSKIESGQLKIEQRSFDLVECIEDVYDLLAFKAQEKNLDLLYSIEPSLPRMVVGDVTRVRQILLNLVGNAVKFTLQGQILTTVSGVRIAGNRLQLHFDVHDTGIGIPPEAIGQLFTAFTQVDSSTTRRFGGTGLGLAISKRLVELMEGTISVSSTLGSGSTFTFTIDVGTADSAPTLYLRSRVDALSGKRVLIVDDNPTNIEILRSQCSLWGMYPAFTTRPDEALGWLKRGDRFDIGLLDMQMPEMDGVDLARAIRLLRTAEEFPLLLLTSLGDKQVVPEGESLFTALIAKPIKHSQLQEVLANTITGKVVSSRRSLREEDQRSLGSTLPLSILVAEDNPVNQKLILRILHTLGYEATLVSNGREAVEAAQKTAFDIILMDVNMPEMDGLEATGIILSRSTEGRPPTVIALTAGVLQEDKDRCAKAGMVDFLTKPFHMNEIRAAIERWGTQRREASVPKERDIEASMMARLRQLSDETDPGFVKDLVRDFIPHGDRRIKELDELLQKHDPQALRQAAHALKGGALNMGARALATYAEQLQTAAERLDEPAFAGLIHAIADQWVTTRADFEYFLSH